MVSTSSALKGKQLTRSTPSRIPWTWITSFPPPSRLSRRSLLAYLSKALPNLTVDTTSSVKPSTTLYVHIFAFDLARAVRYAVHSVGKESSLIQWSGASCICMVNRLNASGVRGEYNRRKAGLLLVATSTSLRLNLKDYPWSSEPMLCQYFSIRSSDTRHSPS